MVAGHTMSELYNMNQDELIELIVELDKNMRNLEGHFLAACDTDWMSIED